jgi:hypothetical protein
MAVVASDLPVYHRACADGAGVLAQGRDQWRQSILRLIERPQERASMIEAAERKLREQYSHARLREQVAGIFEQVLAVGAKAA